MRELSNLYVMIHLSITNYHKHWINVGKCQTIQSTISSWHIISDFNELWMQQSLLTFVFCSTRQNFLDSDLNEDCRTLCFLAVWFVYWAKRQANNAKYSEICRTERRMIKYRENEEKITNEGEKQKKKRYCPIKCRNLSYPTYPLLTRRQVERETVRKELAKIDYNRSIYHRYFVGLQNSYIFVKSNQITLNYYSDMWGRWDVSTGHVSDRDGRWAFIDLYVYIHNICET